VKEGIDVAIRMGDMHDSTLVARRFASQSLVLVAAPSYLERLGMPRTLDQLAGYDHITFRMPTSGRPRPQQFSVNGKVVALHPASRLRFDDGVAMARAAMLGLGLAQVPDNMVHREMASGQLAEVLPQHRPPIMPISAVIPGNRMIPSRVRALLDALDAYAQEQRVAAAARATVNKPPRTRSKARAS
jgi:LysR family transcriptional regulator, regulator for bpeEF and oprC